MEYDLEKINQYLKELMQDAITAESVLLKLALKILEESYSECEILDLDLALACLIDITIRVRKNQEIIGTSSRTEKIGTAEISVTSSMNNNSQVNKNWLSFQWLTSIALNCPQCLIGLTGYSGYLNSGMDRSR